MYCTIQTVVASTASLSTEALAAHRRLSRHAETLAGFSASFVGESLAVAEAYARALHVGGRDSWVAFVAAAAVVASHGASIASLIHFNSREQEAYEFFAEIVRENDDLLVGDAGATGVPLPAPAIAEQKMPDGSPRSFCDARR